MLKITMLGNCFIAGLLGSILGGTSVSAAVNVNCASAEPWSANKTYTAGRKVLQDNALYEALWWTQNQLPSSTVSYGPWAQVSICGIEPANTCALDNWYSSSIYNTGQQVVYDGFAYTAQWWTRGQAPGAGSASAWLKGEACGPITEVETCDKNNSIALVVDSAFKFSLQNEITRLAQDIKTEQDVCIHVIDVNSTTSPTQIRNKLKTAYHNAGLKGAVLIGDVPGVLIGDQLFDGYILPPSLSDDYYEVLNDNVWVDPDNNGIFNITGGIPGEAPDALRYHSRSVNNERTIWTGRLTPPKGLSLVERVARMRAYLDRNHAYRTGQKHYSKGMIYFNSVGHNQLPNDYELDSVTNQAHAVNFYVESGLHGAPGNNGLRTIWNDDLTLQLESWKTEIQQDYEYALVNVHGAYDFQQFGVKQYLFGTDLLSSPSNVLLTDFASCNNGMYESPHYMAGYALFSGQSLAVRAFTVPVFIVGSPEAGADQILLSLGKTLGEVRQMTSGLFVSIFFGDPTLRLRPASSEGPVIAVSESNLIFPVRAASDAPFAAQKTVTFTNTGNRSIKMYRGADVDTTWNNQGALNRSIITEAGFSMGIDPLFSAGFEHAHVLFAELAPGQSIDLPIYFSGDSPNPLPGIYTWKSVFFTNSAAQPMITVSASQQLL